MAQPSSTVTATLSTDWNKDVAVTIPAATNGLTVTNSPLSFTSGASGNWGTAQTATVKLPAAPAKTIVVDFTRLDLNDPEVTPKYLTFTTSDWNTAQTVSLKFLAEPTDSTTRVSIQGTGSSKTYKVNLDAYRWPYDLGNPAVIVAEGATTGTETLTAQNDYNDLANATATLSLATHPTDDDWISKGTGTAPSLTITDDDELGQVTGVSVVQKTGTAGNLAGGATVTWTKVTNATGYIIEWKSGAQIYDSSRRLVAGDVATYDVPASNLTPGTAYDIRVYATKSNSDHGLPSDEISFTYTGWLVFDKTQVNITELVTGTQTGTYTVALSAAPSSNVTVNLSYRVPQMTLDPSTITFNSTNWSQWQPFTVEADQFPPRGTGRNDWTNVTFNDTSELDFRNSSAGYFDPRLHPPRKDYLPCEAQEQPQHRQGRGFDVHVLRFRPVHPPHHRQSRHPQLHYRKLEHRPDRHPQRTLRHPRHRRGRNLRPHHRQHRPRLQRRQEHGLRQADRQQQPPNQRQLHPLHTDRPHHGEPRRTLLQLHRFRRQRHQIRHYHRIPPRRGPRRVEAVPRPSDRRQVPNLPQPSRMRRHRGKRLRRPNPPHRRLQIQHRNSPLLLPCQWLQRRVLHLPHGSTIPATSPMPPTPSPCRP